MKSAVRFHFPQVVFEKHQKKLFNPVLKKRFVNRPEERVRLKWLEYLLFETDWKRNRISFESPVTVNQSENKQRADLILYSEEMKPNILIECKSEKVALTDKTGEQIARYNADLGAKYLILSNGVTDLRYEINEGRAKAITNLFSSNIKPFNRDSDYWSKRGFSGINNSDKTDVKLQLFLNRFWSEYLDSDVRYLSFQAAHIQFPIDQYYRIYRIESDTKLAISTVGQGDSETFLVAVLNQKGINKAILYLNLDHWIENRSETVLKVSEKGEDRGELKMDLSAYFSNEEQSDFIDFSKDVMKLF